MKKVVLLEYFDRNTDDTLLLGFFSENKLKETIEYYNTLSGFCNHTGEYVYNKVFSVKGAVLYFLQIWNIHNEDIVFQKVFELYDDAESCLKSLRQYTDNENYKSEIDKYIVDEKCWTEGFITL